MNKDSSIKGGDSEVQGMVNQVDKAFNDSIGVVLMYLDEAEVGMATKAAVKAELWRLCDKKVKVIIGGMEHGEEINGNV